MSGFADKLKETWNKAFGKSKELADKAKDMMNKTGDKAKDTADDVVDAADDKVDEAAKKEGAVGDAAQAADKVIDKVDPD